MIRFFSFRRLTVIALLAAFLAPFVSQASAAQTTGKKLVLPRGRGTANDYNNPDNEFSFARSVQGPDVAIFWSKEYGSDPMKNPDKTRTFDVNNMLNECERYYKTYVDDLKIVIKGKSVSDKYKLVISVVGGPGGTAFGGGEGDIGTLSTPATRVNRPPYGVLAHEMMHSFQSISRADRQGGGGINAEMAAQYGLWQNLPEWMTFENYHLVAWMNATHLSFGASENMYHTAQVLEFWAYKRGRDFYGNMMRSSVQGDAITVYKSMYNLNQDQFNDELFDGYCRFMTWDIPRIDKVAHQYANQHHTDMNAIDGGWFQIAKTKTPQNYGYNGIKIKVPAAGTAVTLDFKGIAGAEGYSNVNVDKAGWRYGFVASLKDGSRVYGDVGRGKEGKLTFKVPADTNYLWLVVMGAPTEHPSSGGGRGGFGGPGGSRGAANAIARQVTSMAELNLKPDQISKLNAMPASDANIAAAVTNTQTAVNAAAITADDAKVKDAIKGFTDATEKNALAQAADYKKIKDVLTPEQYKQMTDSLIAPAGRGGARGGTRGGTGAGAPGGGQAQLPYQIKLTGTTVDDSVLGKK